MPRRPLRLNDRRVALVGRRRRNSINIVLPSHFYFQNTIFLGGTIALFLLPCDMQSPAGLTSLSRARGVEILCA